MKKIIILLLSFAINHHANSMENNIGPSLIDFVHHPNSDGKTALHLISEITEKDSQDLALADLQKVGDITDFIWWGAKINLRDNEGKTPLDYAALNKDKLPKVYEFMQACQDTDENDKNSDKYRQADSIIRRYLNAPYSKP